MRIAVAGGTGLVGSLVVAEVRERGHEAVVLARSTGVDLTTGDGVRRALEGVDVVIDTSNVDTLKRSVSVAFFEGVTRHLLEAEQAAGVGRHVVLSIVGVDRVDFGYYAGKLRQEELAQAGAIPTTVLRSTQFYEFAGQLLDRSGRLVIVPRMLSKPVAAREVAHALVDLATHDRPDPAYVVSGPEQHWMHDLVRRLAKARSQRRWIVKLRLLGAAGRGMVSGGLLPEGSDLTGKQSFDDWLETQ
jgi:uncharacterized protein YbjT (DUF2867 family)